MDEVHNAIAIATENIAFERARTRIKQKDIAKKTGLGVSTVSKIFNDIEGKGNPSTETLLMIWIVGLGKMPEDLFVRGGFGR